MSDQARIKQNEEFLKRLIERNPDAINRYLPMLMAANGGKLPASLRGALNSHPPKVAKERMEEGMATLEAGSGFSADFAGSPPDISGEDAYGNFLETIARGERPVLFVAKGKPVKDGAWLDSIEAEQLADDVVAAGDMLASRLASVGRIDVRLRSGEVAHLGTGWFVADDVIVTNSHVATAFAEANGKKFRFRTYRDGTSVSSLLDTAREEEEHVDGARVFELAEVLFIYPNENKEDIAFFRVKRVDATPLPGFIRIKRTVEEGGKICVLGYPGRGSEKDIPKQDWMDDIFQRRYSIKRVAPGLITDLEGNTVLYDSTTLGGNSGSVVLDLASGEAVALHHSGRFEVSNYGLGAGVLARYVDGKLWERPYEIQEGKDGEGGNKPAPAPKPVLKPGAPAPAPVTQTAQPGPVIAAGVAGAQTHTITFPLVLTVGLGAPVLSANLQPQGPATITPGPVGAAAAESAAKLYWGMRRPEVVGVRVGYDEEDGQIGNSPMIAVSVKASQLEAFAARQEKVFHGVPVRFFAASVAEQLDAEPEVETAGISYDDDARTGAGFSFEPVEEQMNAIFQAGPEHAWEQLEAFLSKAESSLVSSMYEFHSIPVKDAIEARMAEGASFTLIVDGATFDGKIGEDRFDPREVFEEWSQNYQFERIIAPQGGSGLIANSYHMKVTVRDGNTFWMSSGNWKSTSSQPVITPEELQAARDRTADLRGNRDWHAVVKSRTLAKRFANHIRQDFQRSEDLGGRIVPRPRRGEIMVDVPVEELEEGFALEARRPPSKIMKPLKINRSLKVQPLLTPDQQGAVYSEAMLDLIQTATDRLWLQIPYISMRRIPDQDRGYIDQLIDALCDQLLNLRDARVLLRGGKNGGKEYSSPLHVAWYFQSRGVDVRSRIRRVDDHHTKGMIVDGDRVLMGSHNWSASGVTLNRDASLLIHDDEVAGYYADAFEVDWERSNAITPRRHVPQDREILEARGLTPPAGYKRMLLSEYLEEAGD